MGSISWSPNEGRGGGVDGCNEHHLTQHHHHNPLHRERRQQPHVHTAARNSSPDTLVARAIPIADHGSSTWDGLAVAHVMRGMCWPGSSTREGLAAAHMMGGICCPNSSSKAGLAAVPMMGGHVLAWHHSNRSLGAFLGSISSLDPQAPPPPTHTHIHTAAPVTRTSVQSRVCV